MIIKQFHHGQTCICCLLIPLMFYKAGDITEIPIHDQPSQLSVTAVLHFCKNKIVNPYLRLLSIMGLRPLSLEPPERCSLLEIFSHYYTLQVIGLMIMGYVLQYMACFRRDRGFGYKLIEKNSPLYQTTLEKERSYEQVCQGSVLFSFIIPNVLHLIAYLHAVAVFRSSDDDQLPSLMERVSNFLHFFIWLHMFEFYLLLITNITSP